MKIKKVFYEEIYFIDSPEYLTDKQWNNLLMSGKKNWDKYFTPFKTKREHEVIKNVELVKFELESDMLKYIKSLSPFSLLNFSFEHEKPCLLKLV
ncbi:MAG: hypothetical protein V1652_04045 [bacterium]